MNVFLISIAAITLIVTMYLMAYYFVGRRQPPFTPFWEPIMSMERSWENARIPSHFGGRWHDEDGRALEIKFDDGICHIESTDFPEFNYAGEWNGNDRPFYHLTNSFVFSIDLPHGKVLTLQTDRKRMSVTKTGIDSEVWFIRKET